MTGAPTIPGALPEGATAAYAAFVAASPRRGLDADVRRATCRAYANWTACAIGGQREPDVHTLQRVVMPLSGQGRASIVGRDVATDCMHAALLNGYAANALDYDDMHVPTLIHPTVPVVAAALAVAEERRVTGEVLAVAIAAGIEVECRLGLALFPQHYDAGWHSTATLGTLGAAAAACVAAGLGAERVAHAFGIAATQASGLRAMLPYPCKSFNTGHAAASGVLAMLLAEAGLDSDPAVLEAPFGLFHVYGPVRDPAALVADLGPLRLVTEVSLKPYPCGVVIHPLIDACLALAAEAGCASGTVRALHAAVHPRALVLAGRPHPETAITARFSLHHAAALALAYRSAGLRAFEAHAIDEPELVRLRSLMSIVPDATLAPGEAVAQLELADGRTLEQRVRHSSGSPERPLTEAQLEHKFMELVQPVLGEDAGHALLADCLALDALPDVSALRRHWAKAP